MNNNSPFLPHVSRVAVVGDLHGAVSYTQEIINIAFGDRNGKDADVILQVGDFGFWNESFINAVQKMMEAYEDKIFLFIDGNHENHPLLNAQPIDDDGVRRLTKQVWHLPRGFRWTWKEKHCIAVGGAPSVNVLDLTSGWNWFPEEVLSHQEYADIVAGEEVDIVFAHDAPSGYEIPGLLPEGTFHPNVIANAEHYRESVMRGIGNALHPTRWFHGHYHVGYEDHAFWDDGTPCFIRGLGRDGQRWTQVMEFVDFSVLN